MNLGCMYVFSMLHPRCEKRPRNPQIKLHSSLPSGIFLQETRPQRMHLARTKVVSPHGQGQFVHRPQLDGSGSHVLTQYTTTKTGICKNAKLMPKLYETSKTGLVFSSVVLLPKRHRHFGWVWLPNTIWCLWRLNCNMRVLLLTKHICQCVQQHFRQQFNQIPNPRKD